MNLKRDWYVGAYNHETLFLVSLLQEIFFFIFVNTVSIIISAAVPGKLILMIELAQIMASRRNVLKTVKNEECVSCQDFLSILNHTIPHLFLSQLHPLLNACINTQPTFLQRPSKGDPANLFQTPSKSSLLLSP